MYSFLILANVLLPWLHGLTDDTVVEGGTQCLADDAPLRLQADVSPAAGIETITATMGGGMYVTSAEGIPIAASPGVPCEGSADSLDVLAVGTIFHERTIVLSFSTGGYREGWTWLGVYRVGLAGHIDPLFAGVVETREDGIVREGRVTFLPGALIYRPPGGGDSLWVLDPVVHTYTPRGPFGHEGEPHS